MAVSFIIPFNLLDSARSQSKICIVYLVGKGGHLDVYAWVLEVGRLYQAPAAGKIASLDPERSDQPRRGLPVLSSVNRVLKLARAA